MHLSPLRLQVGDSGRGRRDTDSSGPPCDQCGVSYFQMCNAEQVLAQARKRKRRTSIETNVKGTLESFFRKCVKPSPQEISQIAEDLNLDKDVGLAGLGGRGGPKQLQLQSTPWGWFGGGRWEGGCARCPPRRSHCAVPLILAPPPSPLPRRLSGSGSATGVRKASGCCCPLATSRRG